MTTARVFQSGNSQAVRLPKQFRISAKEVEIFQRGDEIVLKQKARGLSTAFHLLTELPEDMFLKDRKDSIPQRRRGL